MSESLFEGYDACIKDAKSERMVIACNEKFNSKDWPDEKKEKADELISRHAIEEIDEDELSELIDESYAKDKEIKVSVCADGSLKSKVIGERTKTKTRVGPEGCRIVAAELHTHQAKGTDDSLISPSIKDIFSMYQVDGIQCIARRQNIGPPNNPEVKNAMACFMPDKSTEIGKELSEVEFEPDAFRNEMLNADQFERHNSYKLITRRNWGV